MHLHKSDKINFTGNGAVVEVMSTGLGDENHFFKMNMLKENDQWYILKQTCS
jgi:hypothetical protein